MKDDLEAAREMASEDPDFAEEAKRLEGELPAAEEKLRTALIPRDPDDARDTIMEIKAGTGGEEAALFAGDLLRMYMRYAEKRGWSVTVQSENTTELGGVKDVQLAIRAKGTPAPEDGVWASLKYEGGVHRVQRIPVTESQGRIQTSAAGVIVFPEADEDDDEIEIDPKDLKIDIFMSSGPGGQSVNTTYSAVRMTHLPTGITVNMQDEKSQIQNRAAALRVLKSRLLAMKHEQEAAEAAINYNTVSKVYVNLESDGYVESVRGRGVFVRDIGGKADDVRSIADTEIEGCIRRCLALGMTIDEVTLRMMDVTHRLKDEKS